MAQDFTTYTEVDENSDITRTSAKVTWTDMDRDCTSYVYKDFGADYFEDLDVDFEIQFGSSGDLYGQCAWIIFGNNLADLNDYYNQDLYPGIGMVGTRDSGGSGLHWGIHDFDNNQADVDNSVGLTSDTTYYCTLTRVGSTITLNVYTDSGRTTHHSASPLQITGTNRKYRYILVAVGNDSNETGRDISGYIEALDFVNLQLQELTETCTLSDSVLAQIMNLTLSETCTLSEYLYPFLAYPVIVLEYLRSINNQYTLRVKLSSSQKESIENALKFAGKLATFDRPFSTVTTNDATKGSQNTVFFNMQNAPSELTNPLALIISDWSMDLQTAIPYFILNVTGFEAV